MEKWNFQKKVKSPFYRLALITYTCNQFTYSDQNNESEAFFVTIISGTIMFMLI